MIQRAEYGLDEAREWASGGRLFAILDACDTPSVLEKVAELGDERAVSLYRGTAEEELEAIAPYLVVVDPAVFDWIVDTLWDEPWGVFVHSGSNLGALRTHFRKFLIVDSPEGEKWYFRFYDPRVLTVYLPTCTEEEVAEFFGPVWQFGVANVDRHAVVTLAPSPNVRSKYKHLSAPIL